MSEGSEGSGRGGAEAGERAAELAELVLEFPLDAPAEKVWRAIETPHLRERWLPGCPLAEAEHRVSDAGREVRFRMWDDEPPHVETTVTFQVLDGVGGGSLLRIVHAMPAGRAPDSAPANDAGPVLMRAA